MNDNSIQEFDELNLSSDILRGIFAYGFEKPSKIQKVAIPPFLEGRDLIAQSQSGTGKTATFAISVLQTISVEDKCVQSIIISPTRELAQQTVTVFNGLGQFMNGLSVLCCIGGFNRREQIDTIQKGAQIIIGTPGRIVDFLENRIFKTNHIRSVIIDEADVMLSEDFQQQIKTILQFIPMETQCALYSATLPPRILEITEKFMKEPLRVLVKRDELTLEGITQTYVELEDHVKLETLSDIYSTCRLAQTIIFCNQKKTADKISEMLAKDFLHIALIHSDMTQEERSLKIHKFRQGECRVLIATDVICRGIDIQQVSMVINYDLPANKENYLHRIGRSGRFGRKGFALNFISPLDSKRKKDIEEFYATEFEPLMEEHLSKFK